MKKLYIEYRVYFNPDTNQELLTEIAEIAQDEIYTLFENAAIDESPMPSPHDVTYEIVMEVSKEQQLLEDLHKVAAQQDYSDKFVIVKGGNK